MAFKMKNSALAKKADMAACPRAAAKMQAESAMKAMSKSPAEMESPTKAMTKSPAEFNAKLRKAKAEGKLPKEFAAAVKKKDDEMESPVKNEDGGKKKKKSREATPDDIVKRSKGKFKKDYYVDYRGKKVSVKPDGSGGYTYKGDPVDSKIVKERAKRTSVSYSDDRLTGRN